MVSYACGFNQSEMGKYFEWIVWFVSGEQILCAEAEGWGK